MQRYTAHGESIPLDDIICNYNDILDTANELSFEMPHYKELSDLIKS
jgi:hypothetical protein